MHFISSARVARRSRLSKPTLLPRSESVQSDPATSAPKSRVDSKSPLARFVTHSMSRREGPLGGLGVRGARARVAPVDEAAMQAKLRELRQVMAK